jgi:hypothetical protein
MRKVFFIFVIIFLTISGFAQNVGIGTTSPAFKLDVKNGSINTDSVYRIGGITVLSIPYGNTFTGFAAGASNSTGQYNVASGFRTLYYNTTGSYNTANGVEALRANTTGNFNTAYGYLALFSNIYGNDNTAIGTEALRQNNTGIANTGVGYQALYLSNGSSNTGIGYHALKNTIAGVSNVAVGVLAGYDNLGSNNTFIGCQADAYAPLSNAVALGNEALVSASHTVRIGNFSITSISGMVGWTTYSDGRFKKNINENVPGLDFISKLRPVTYTLDAKGLYAFYHKNQQNKEPLNANANKVYQTALQEKEKIIYTGFIAQEVEATAKALGFDFSGVDAAKNENDTYGLRYAEFVVPLVKGMQEQQEIINGLKKQNNELLKRIEKLEVLLTSK